jgi:hypothetical protein
VEFFNFLKRLIVAIENLQNHSIKLAVLIYNFSFWLAKDIYIYSQPPNTKKRKKEKEEKGINVRSACRI